MNAPLAMDLGTVHDLYSALAGDRLCFLYSGAFHDGHTARLITLGEEAVATSVGDRSLSNKLAFVMVEAYQNIIRHRMVLPEVVEHGAGRSMFMLRDHGAGLEVTTRNPVEREGADELATALGRLDRMDPTALKQLFLSSLQSGQRTRQGGAGLGLIEIARRSGQGIRHRITNLSGSASLFTLQVNLSGRGAQFTDHEALQGILRKVAREDILLFHKGALTPGVQNAILRMLGTDLDERSRGHDVRPRAFHALLELFQGIPDRTGDPLIVLGRHEAGDALALALPVATSAIPRLKELIDGLQVKERATLHARYRDAMLGRIPQGGKELIALLDLASRSVTPLRAEFREHAGGMLLVLEAVV